MAAHDRTPAWKHFTADVSGIGARSLNEAKKLQALLGRALSSKGLGATHWTRHEFEPQGVSLIAFGPRGRLALHTWPEHEFATLDLWTCSGGGQEILEACTLAIAQRRRRPATQAIVHLSVTE